MVEAKYIIKLQGKEFVTHAGLLDEAHKQGLVSIMTEHILLTKEQAIMKATVTLKDKDKEPTVFTGYGDADSLNTNVKITVHKIRMAETRAINRALRFATNIGMCSIEELGGTPAEPGKPKPKPTSPKQVDVCSECESGIVEKVAKYSQDKYGKHLCLGCQGREI